MLIKTRDPTLDQRVGLAMAEAERLAEEEKSPQKRVVLIQIFHAAINFWIAEYLGLDDLDNQKRQYIDEIDRLHALPDIKLNEKEVVVMLGQIMAIITTEDSSRNAERHYTRRGRRRRF